MRSVLEGEAADTHAAAIATVVLRGLGVAPAEAEAITTRSLPPLGGAPTLLPKAHGRRARRAAGS
jgi:hypothetical protein